MNCDFVAIDSVKNINGNYYINIVDNRFDLQTSQIVAHTCLNLLEKEDIKKLILNFNSISYITTSGIGSLLDIYYQFSYCNKVKLYLYNVNDDIKENLKSVMVDTILNIVDDDYPCLWN